MATKEDVFLELLELYEAIEQWEIECSYNIPENPASLDAEVAKLDQEIAEWKKRYKEAK